MDLLVVNFQDAQHPYAGGAEVHLCEVFGRLGRRGHRVTLLCAGWRGAPRRCRDHDIEIHRVGTRATFPFLARRYFELHLVRPWDVIVEDLNKAALRAHLWSAHPTALLVHHLFGRSAFAATNPPVAAAVLALELSLGRLYRGVPTIAVSESTATDLRRRGIDERDIVVIPNGVALPSGFHAAAATGFTARLIYVGRLQPYKRVDVLLRAIRRLADARVDVALDIVGDGAYRASLMRLSRQLGVDHLVTFHGYVTEEVKQSLIARAAWHISTSEKEGWGLSVLEAGIWGVPTIATHVAGLRDSVIEGRTGRFVPVNDPVATADTIRRSLDDPAARAALGEGARRFALEHSWESVADRMEAFLGDVASGGRRHPRGPRQLQRDPFLNAPLPRTGQGAIAFGTQRATVRLSLNEMTIDLVATIGARDPAGRWPAIELSGLPRRLQRLFMHRPEGVRRIDREDAVIWELWEWPVSPLEWIQETLITAIPDGAVDVEWAATTTTLPAHHLRGAATRGRVG